LYRITKGRIEKYCEDCEDYEEEFNLEALLVNSITPYHPFLFATAVAIFIVTGKDFKNTLANYCFLEPLSNEILLELTTLKEFTIDDLEKIRQVEVKLLDELMRIGVESFICENKFSPSLKLDEASILDIYWHVWKSTCAENVVFRKILNQPFYNKTNIDSEIIYYSMDINSIIHNSREYFKFMLSQIESKLNDALSIQDKESVLELLKHRQTILYFIKRSQDLYYQLPHEIKAFLVSHLASHNSLKTGKDFKAFMPLPEKSYQQIYECYEKHRI
jgi:hypothetical protein